MAGWQSIRTEVLQRISRKDWPAGELIPGEVVLAKEFGCARATVNRALRQLADEGLLDRRRKGGTRVALHPVRKATLDIPITRLEIEQRGSVYGYKLLSGQSLMPPTSVQVNMKIEGGHKALHLKALHLADGEPFLIEDRWVNLASVPEITHEDFAHVNANEWLIENVPFTAGTIAFAAANTTTEEADVLKCERGAAIFTVKRTTWRADASITFVRLAYAPGFQMETLI